MLPAILLTGAALLVSSIVSNRGEIAIKKSRLFISHSWQYSTKEYKNFISKLKYEEDFYNHSIPEDKAFSQWEPDKLRAIFRRQMSGCQKIFVLAHRNVKKESYVGIELEITAELGKEIIAVKPYGQYGVPSFIRKHSNQVISNNITSITRVLQP
jgi:hypothetical protein